MITIDQLKYEISQKATNLLLTILKGGTIEKKKFVMKDELIIREACGFLQKEQLFKIVKGV